MATAFANQSVELEAVLDAVADLIGKAVALRARNVIEWYGEARPDATLPGPVVRYRWVDEDLDVDSGAGRHGTRDGIVFEVVVQTRGFKDGGQRDKKLGRDHLATRFLLVNAFAGRMLHSAYDAAVGDEPPKPAADATLLSAGGTMQLVKLPAPDRPRPEQGQVETRLGIRVPCVLKVTLNDAPAAD